MLVGCADGCIIKVTCGARSAVALRAWAGPWPTEEHWWDPARRRRRARFQLLTVQGEAVLVSLEQGSWWLEARYC